LSNVIRMNLGQYDDLLVNWPVPPLPERVVDAAQLGSEPPADNDEWGRRAVAFGEAGIRIRFAEPVHPIRLELSLQPWDIHRVTWLSGGKELGHEENRAIPAEKPGAAFNVTAFDIP